MNEQIEILIKLQKIETEAVGLKSAQNDVSKKLETLDNSLNEFKQNIKDQESTLDSLRKKYRDYESNSQMNLDREKKTKEKLRAVKTNREYQSLLKEIEDVKAKNSDIEDEMIESLDRMENVEKVISTKKDEYTQLKNQIDNEKENIKQKAEESKKKLEKLNTEMDVVTRKIDPTLLKKYLTIKEEYKRGLAVVPVQNAICRGCNVNLPPQLYNELHRCDELRYCPNCQRIIYWKQQ
jgi:predicted  nucleic acid-binding Zn-ribbon protein